MAKDGYWDDQFNRALPVFLANWYASTFIEEIECACASEGICSLLRFTNGYYKTDLVGEWIVKHTGAMGKILGFLKEGAARGDPIHRALYSRIALAGIKNENLIASIDFAKYPEQLCKATAHALGKHIQRTAWWKAHLGDIKRGSRDVLAVKRIMER